jgi:hypothetical protein
MSVANVTRLVLLEIEWFQRKQTNWMTTGRVKRVRLKHDKSVVLLSCISQYQTLFKADLNGSVGSTGQLETQRYRVRFPDKAGYVYGSMLDIAGVF